MLKFDKHAIKKSAENIIKGQKKLISEMAALSLALHQNELV